MPRTRSVVQWSHVFRNEGDVECALCGGKERTVVVADGRVQGVCEACTVHAYWAWKRLPADAEPEPPSEVARSPRRIKILLARLRELDDGALASAGIPESYDFGTTASPDGEQDLPSVDVSRDEPLAASVDRALALVGLRTWPGFAEPLYAALVPRSYLSQVVLVTACAPLSQDDMPSGAELPKSQPLSWREWPPWEQVPGLATFYLALSSIWPLRIWRHQHEEPRTTSITTLLRKGAADYVRMQRQLRSGARGVDTSTSEVLRRAMTADEKLVDRLIRENEEREGELREERASDKTPVVGLELEEGVPDGFPDDSSSSSSGEGAGAGDEVLGEDDFDPREDSR